MTPVKDAKQDQWWDSSHSEYVVDTTITSDTNGRITRFLCVGSLVGSMCWLERALRAPKWSPGHADGRGEGRVSPRERWGASGGSERREGQGTRINKVAQRPANK